MTDKYDWIADSPGQLHTNKWVGSIDIDTDAISSFVTDIRDPFPVKVTGDFRVIARNLKSLKGSPENVIGKVRFSSCNLSNLQFAPRRCGRFVLKDNRYGIDLIGIEDVFDSCNSINFGLAGAMGLSTIKRGGLGLLLSRINCIDGGQYYHKQLTNDMTVQQIQDSVDSLKTVVLKNGLNHHETIKGLLIINAFMINTAGLRHSVYECQSLLLKNNCENMAEL